MATYTETAWGSSDTTFPSSILTKRWSTSNETTNECHADTGAESGYVLAMEWSANGLRFNSYDASTDGNAANIELLSRFKLEGTTRSDWEYINVLRGSGSAGSETGYYIGLLEGASNDIGLRAQSYSSGTFNGVIQDSGDILESVGTEWLWMRCRINGTSIRARIWRDSSPEPTVWHIDATDSTISAEGWNGVGVYWANYRTEVDYLSAGTNGDTAPKTADTTETIRGTVSNAHVLVQHDNPTTRVTTTNAHVLVQHDNPTVRVTTTNMHVLYTINNPEVRLTTEHLNVLIQEANPEARLTTEHLNVLLQEANPETRLTTAHLNVLYEVAPPPELTQQVAELAVQQNLANVEVRSTQQIVEMLVYQPKIPSLTQQVAEAAIQQDAANVEVRSTQQITEVLYKTSALNVYLTKQTAELAVQKTTGVFTRSTQQIVEVLMSPPTADPAYDNFDAQPISVMA